MVKGISSINGLVKSGIVAAMLTGSVAVYASKPIKNSSQHNQTEVVSKECAEALKVASLQSAQQAQVPSTRNQKLDSALKKYATNSKELAEINELLNTVYKNYGTFLSSAIIQHEINCQQLGQFMNSKTDLMVYKNINPDLGKKIKAFGPDFFKTVTPAKESMDKWIKDEYTPALLGLMMEDKKLSFREMDLKLSSIVDKKIGLTSQEISEVYAKEADFRKNKLKGRTDDMAKSEMVAYSVFLIDQIAFEKAMRARGVFGKGRFELGRLTLNDYFRDWMDSVNPSK